MPLKASKDQERLDQLIRAMLGGGGGAFNVVSPVVREGDKIIVPENVDMDDLIKSLEVQRDKERQPIDVKSDMPVPPWDGSRALQDAIKKETGLVIEQANWMGTAGTIEVEVALDKTELIHWGTFALPNMGTDAYAETSVSRNEESGLWQFTCKIHCMRLHKERAEKILATTRHLALTNSMHKGKAFSIKYLDESGGTLRFPTPRFFPLTMIKPIFRRDLELAIERYILVPMQYADILQEAHEPLKRGILLAGDYGMGKTLLASYLAGKATKAGWSFMYVKDARELDFALREAPRFGKTLVYAEDADRVAGEDRDDNVNSLLNQLDGIDSKATEVMVVLTTNHPEKINKALIRPGRIDLTLRVEPPDEEAVQRLVKQCAGASLEDGANLSGISTTLAGYAPAHISEAVRRARFEALRRTGDWNSLINGDDLTIVAREVAGEKEFHNQKRDTDPDKLNRMADGFEATATVLREHAGNGANQHN